VHPLHKHIMGGNLKPDEWIKIYSAAKIALAIHYQDGVIICYQASPKVYEILACATFLITDAQKDVLSLFRDKDELVVFNDVVELRRILKYYLDHPQEREIIAQKGREKTIKEHTYIKRIKRIIEVVSG